MAPPLKAPPGAAAGKYARTGTTTPTPRTQPPSIGGSTPNIAPSARGNLSSSSASRSKGPVRGVTPTKRGATGAAAAAELPPALPDLDLTPEEQLEIMERLEKGQFQTGAGAGWSQFLDPIHAKRRAQQAQQGPKCQQNLTGAFASLELNQNGNMTSNQGQGKGQESASATTNAIPDDPDIPLWMKRLEELIDAVDSSKSLFERTISALFEAQFAEYIPPDQFTRFMTKMEGTMENLKFITENNFGETTRLFFQSTSPPKKPSLPCPVEDQEEFIASMGTLSNNLKKMNGFFGHRDEGIDFEGMVQDFNKMVDEIDEDLKSTEVQLKEIEIYSALMKKYLEKAEADEWSSSESSWSEGEDQEEEGEGRDMNGNNSQER